MVACRASWHCALPTARSASGRTGVPSHSDSSSRRRSRRELHHPGGGMLIVRVLAAAAVFTSLTAFASSAPAQLGSLRKKAEEAKKKVEAAVDKKPSVDSAKTKPASSTPSGTTPASASSEPASTAAAAPASAAPASAKVWENYDFVPGSKILFFTDFSEDKVGNFARGLKYRGGPAEVVERSDTKVLRATGNAEFLIPIGRKLPERFTLEVDVIAPLSGAMNRALSFEGGAASLADDKSAWITWNPQGAWIQGSGLNMSTGSAKAPDAMVSAIA